ncbi:tail completion protein gp17 [Wolbachia endosymbiont of Folsomia candida]|uniref:tail completion protein gp17 n=1 Tax=Wolbachia endosymbiont of Folsomia candida TaxID=169402 RepID=UPI000AB88F0D|nr:DUF3168 domain-containing protein [Wolbachia endosymbiont of Folsomia candida]APR98895.1 DUF3168 domain-containing protein [Wolbachia endosymbiont of Folsomia candida]
MRKIQAIHKLYSEIYTALKANSDLKQCVTNIYDYLPKQVTIPYLRLRVVNYNNLNMLSNFAVKAKFSCDIYTHHIDSMFAITKHINSTLQNIKYSDDESVSESNCTMNQYDEILHSTINFDVLIKGDNNEQIATKD